MVCDYEPRFILENEKKVRVPEIADSNMLRQIADLDMWKLLVKCSKQVRQDDGTRDQIDIDIQCTS